MNSKTARKIVVQPFVQPRSNTSFRSLLPSGSKEITIFRNTDKIKMHFFSQTGTLLSAGVDLQTVLLLASDGTDVKSTELYRSISGEIAHGTSLADAMRHTGQFNDFDCVSVSVGESTGELATVFDKLYRFYDRRTTQKRKMVNALSYPVIVLITALLAVVFMLKFVVPMFADTLTRFGGELPALTRLIISLSNSMHILLSTTAAAVLSFYFFYKKNKDKPAFQRRWTAILLWIPYFGKLIRTVHLIQFTQTMSLLLAARVTIVESIKLTEKVVAFYPLREALVNMQAKILKGEFFYSSIMGEKFFDRSMITLIKIGEEVNQLDRIFAQLTKQYESDLEYQSNLLMTVLEPLLLLFLAIVIGTILIGMYLPMFKIGTVIN